MPSPSCLLLLCVLCTPGENLTGSAAKVKGMSAAAGKPRGDNEEERATGQEK
jgi:hypothetical protein